MYHAHHVLHKQDATPGRDLYLMENHLKLHTITTSTLLSLLIAGAASANTYIKLKPADSLVYGNAAGRTVSVGVTAAGTPGWNKYSAFLGAGERWIWSSPNDESVYLFDETRGSTEKMVNFADPVGSRYAFTLGMCTNSGTLAQKGLLLSTAAGTFRDVVKMTFSGQCADGGLMEAWFAPQVGVIKWSEQSFVGPVALELVDGKVGGQIYGSSTPQTALKMRASFPQSRFIFGDTAAQAGVTLELRNASTEDLTLHFNSGQEFEITLLDAANRAVNNWSAKIRFIQGLHDVTIAAGKSHSFGAALDMRKLDGGTLPVGSYTLRIEMKDSAVGNTTLPSGIRAEARVSVEAASGAN
ncbi:hypothetical protein AAKU55_004648 [Oxalobacteraceae bacterium GrIS 1.11]